MMGKELSEMTLEELWDLFPIFLVQHDDQWNGYYEEIEAVITDLLKKQAPAPATLVYNSLSRSESLEARNSEHTVNRKANHQFVSLIPQLWVQSQSCPLALQ